MIVKTTTEARRRDLSVIDAANPRMNDLLTDFNRSVNESSGLLMQQARDYNTRFALWERQSPDGRKRYGENGEDPRPWKNASDVRIFEADAVVNEQVDMMMLAWARGNLQVSATEMENQWGAVKVYQLMKWMFRVHLRNELADELERFLQWRQTYGYAVMGIWWEQQRRYEPMEFNVLQFVQAIAQDEREAEALVQAVMDPLQGGALEAQMMKQWKGLTPAQARRAVAALREGKTATIPKINIVRSMPRWLALRPYVDVIHRVSARSLQREPRIYLREWLTEDELRDRGELYGWDENWIDAAIAQKGTAGARYGETAGYLTTTMPGRMGDSWVSGSQDAKELIEVIHAYQLGVDARTLAPVRYCTVFQPSVPEKVAIHGADPYTHGQAPFIAGVRELVDVALTESRGVPDIVKHDQAVIKDEVDARRDGAQMTTLPPLLKPIRRALERVKLGPAAQLAEITPGEHRFLQVPVNEGPSQNVEEAARIRVDRYFGRPGGKVEPDLKTLKQQSLINRALTEFSAMTQMTFQLAQQYLEPTTAEMVVGGVSIPMFSGGPDAIRGQYKFLFNFDVQDLDGEERAKKSKTILELLRLDRYGAADTTGLMRLLISSEVPEIGEHYIKPVEAATENELREEDAAFGMIMSGKEPAPPPENSNVELRMQRLQETLTSNPMLSTTQGGAFAWGPLLAGRPDAQAMIQARMKQLQFQATQRKNAVIGQTGSAGGLEEYRGALGMGGME